MKKIFVIFAILSLVAFANAAVIENFEDAATIQMKYPNYSGSSAGIYNVLSTIQTDTKTNDRLDPAIGTPGTKCAWFQFTWAPGIGHVTVTPVPTPVPVDPVATTASGTTWDPFVRITCATTRYPLANTAPKIANGGVGFYYFLPVASGNVEAAICSREEPVSTGDNETYGQTKWIKLTTNDNIWQYVFFNFATDFTCPAADSWVVSSALGDNINDCNTEPADASLLEGILLRPVPGETRVDFNLYVDDIHDGTIQTPKPTPAPPTPTPQGMMSVEKTWALYE